MLNLPFINKISSKEKLFTTKHLSTFLASGVPLAEALDVLQQQSASSYFQKVLKDLHKRVVNGESLAEALSKQKNAFDAFYINMVAVGEKSGTLEKNLEYLSEQLTKEYALRSKVKSALVYPAILVTLTIIMGGFIAFVVLPQLIGFFESFDTQLPLATRILLAVAEIVQNHGVLLVILLALFIVVIRLVYRFKGVTYFWHKVLLKLPYLGRVMTDVSLVRFCRNLGVLLKSGVPITDALETTANTLDNLIFASRIRRLTGAVSGGKSIADELKNSAIFPPIAVKMIAVGEKSGKLDESLLYLAEFFDDEVDEASRNLTALLEPLLLLVIGVVVAFVALAIITPIYELTGSVRR